ncbi:phytoene/squalene synthase family protein [Aureimonas sp. N4]|uniref:phytoene/squalene synthase family protein n=1 Tax=Aureimonas sp. N4 TaxID=1638165 RepID=UPI00244E62F6|nr:phytoene/squalene synthase family protein [Aureimonas sp. N4]
MTDSAPSGGLLSAYAECERIVQDGDPDRAVAVGFATKPAQKHLFALYAFHLETLRIRDLVSQPLPGEIRLQWWRDRLASEEPLEDAAQGSPIATALIATIREHALPLDAFERYLEARVFDLYNDPMPSRADFEAYAGETSSALIMMATMVLDRSAAPSLADACGHAGVGQTAISVLRSEAIHRNRHQVYVPADILTATGIDASTWLAGGAGSERARDAMRAFAREHLDPVLHLWASIPVSVRPALLPALWAGKAPITAGAEPSALRRLWFYWRQMRS